ncbi:hypothetical protein PFISCL1PPCAC_28364 [Pristionchus fissidentatus]|uniref:Metalloendopeptidase n=1 Tax=Pristionchus fissidentatus TaxID=1538716 RepID=A0AAV5WDW1_9BILA|nr:hypothetical protein PFISCL1PPCAC_19932 [Pristionchus fissidentatus]GMT37067.1 hypothetical protein PFISCL1PPCAC_28364 [Pristionchus fissidentatus]
MDSRLTETYSTRGDTHGHSNGIPPPRFFPSVAPLIKTNNRMIDDSAKEEIQLNNLEREISSFSSVHQSINGNYRNVEKIMAAFNNLLADSSKSKKAVISDNNEVGVNHDVSSNLFESDIVLTVPQIKGIVLAEKEKMGRRRVKRKVITGGVYRWNEPSSIPYRLKSNDVKWKKQIMDGMKLWERETCLRFQENYGVDDHIVFYKGSGCFSSVGKTGGSQMISIGDGCDSAGIIAHEIGHALGFWHEQSRPDRDYYILIRREFVASGADKNFLSSSYHEADNMGLPYDYGSIMHYGPEAFSSRIGELTIETLKGRFESTIGQRVAPSFVDIKQMNRLYCNERCRGMQLACRHGGYPDPNDCQSCKCPSGLTGPICNKIEQGCGSELRAGRHWKEITHNGKGDCVWRIKTDNAKIRIRLSRVNFECKRTCGNYVEIKSGTDWQQTGFRTCCNEEWSVLSEAEELLILVKSNSDRMRSMRIEYVRERENEFVAEIDMGRELDAPSIKSWVSGQENRSFRPVDNGSADTFILNSIAGIP